MSEPKKLTREDLNARYERGRVLLGEAYAVLVLDDKPRDLSERIARTIGEYLDATEAAR